MFMFLVCFFVSLFGTSIVDRFGRKGTIVICMFLHVPVCVLLACIPLMGDTGFILCAFLARFVQGIAQAF